MDSITPVAATIWAQLGGHRFVRMTGAKNLVCSENSLMFSLPQRFAKDGINKVRVLLTPDDLYNVAFMKIRGMKVETVRDFEGVYAEDLQDIFTRTTGLYTRL